MDSYKKWEVVSGPDETPLRVHKALSHLRLNVSVFQSSQFFGIFKDFFVIWALVLDFVSI